MSIGIRELDEHIALLRASGLQKELEKDWTGLDCPVSVFLDIIYSESYTALEILQWGGVLSTDLSFLEIGAGAGLFSMFLQRHGYRVRALEPAAQGFEYSHDLCARLQRIFGLELSTLPIAAAELDPEQHGRFDVLYSVNVVEHFQPLGSNLEGMARVLSDRGTMIHTCPNYRVPYEPHFRLPLVPVWPHLTRHLLPRRVRESGLWKSFNFVTYGDVRRYADRHALSHRFRASALAGSLRRLDTDPAFAIRHRGPVKIFGTLFNRIGVTSLLERLPDRWSTPMTFQLSKKR